MPLDAAWPAERVEAILAGTGARVLLAGPALLPGALAGWRSACPRSPAGSSRAWRRTPSRRPGRAAVAAPDGRRLPDPHLRLDRRAEGDRRPSPLGGEHPALEQRDAGDRPGRPHLFVNSICFDLSIYDLLGMLGAGAAVRVATEEELRDPERLAAVLRDEGITTWSSAPAALLQLVPFFPPRGGGARCGGVARR